MRTWISTLGLMVGVSFAAQGFAATAVAPPAPVPVGAPVEAVKNCEFDGPANSHIDCKRDTSAEVCKTTQALFSYCMGRKCPPMSPDDCVGKFIGVCAASVGCTEFH